jgi:hypothetical protein
MTLTVCRGESDQFNTLIWTIHKKRGREEKNMDKMGIISMIMGLVLCAIGGIAVWIFVPEVIIAVKGLIGIVVVLAGLLLLIFGLLIVND